MYAIHRYIHIHAISHLYDTCNVYVLNVHALACIHYSWIFLHGPRCECEDTSNQFSKPIAFDHCVLCVSFSLHCVFIQYLYSNLFVGFTLTLLSRDHKSDVPLWLSTTCCSERSLSQENFRSIPFTCLCLVFWCIYSHHYTSDATTIEHARIESTT